MHTHSRNHSPIRSLPVPPKDYLEEYKDLVAIQALSLINAAICDYHVRNCPASQQLTEVCGKVGAGGRRPREAGSSGSSHV